MLRSLARTGVFILATTLLFSCGEDKTKEHSTVTEEKTSESDNLPTFLSYTLLNQYPHNPTAYTEGLEFIDGYIYESTGHYGRSYLRKYDLTTGKVQKEQKLSDEYFGEGLTVLNDKIYVLTWREKTGMVFDKNSFKQLKTFPIYTKEGWGMTNDGTHLIYSDGTPDIYYIDPETFKEVKRITVTDKYGPVNYINELEWIKGYIYANQWQTNYILKIDPATGEVKGQADLGNIRRQAGIPQPTADENAPEYLNGIAYDKQNNRIFITGKNWPKLFEIKLDN